MGFGKGLVSPNSRVYCLEPKGCFRVDLSWISRNLKSIVAVILLVGLIALIVILWIKLKDPLNPLTVGITAVAVVLVGLVLAGILTGGSPKDQWTWLSYGNFYIVATGIAAVLVGFIVTFRLRPPTTDVEALGFLTALFGAILGLVGTYFGVKQSSDAVAALSGGAGTTTAPTITLTPQTAILPAGQPHNVTATVTSADGTPAPNVSVTFVVTSGPDLNTASTVQTDGSGLATFSLPNTGGAGIDAIQATALGGKGTATVEFQ
jgi:hypothetical protein